MKRIVFRLLACLTGLAIYLGIFHLQMATALLGKAVGQDQPCPWGALIRFPNHVEHFWQLQLQHRTQVKLIREDKEWGISLYQTPTRQFWVRPDGKYLNGAELLAYVIAEQEWVSDKSKQFNVRPGDIVMDVGAHVGTFGDDALRRGASKVIMVEPDPVNVECIRRNYQKEIAEGKVILIPEGAWSEESTLDFGIGVGNSGSGSLVLQESSSKRIQVPVRTIDSMLARVGVDRVDFLKMDIEGAERNALQGAAKLLARSKPRLFLDAYHRHDDDVVLPKVIRAANPSYQTDCPVCSPSRFEDDNRIVPYAIFFY